MKKLDKKVALVTSSTKGIGLASAEILAENGAIVYIAARSEKLANEVIDSIKSKGGVAKFVYFNALKEQGDKVKKGDKLLEVDFDSIKNEGYDTTVLLVITNTQEYSAVKSCEGNKTVDDTIIEIQK